MAQSIPPHVSAQTVENSPVDQGPLKLQWEKGDEKTSQLPLLQKLCTPCCWDQVKKQKQNQMRRKKGKASWETETQLNHRMHIHYAQWRVHIWHLKNTTKLIIEILIMPLISHHILLNRHCNEKHILFTIIVYEGNVN